MGLTSSGWDPYFRPDVPHTPADVVNMGYVINVIEDTAERRQALMNAWNLAQKVLIVAAQVLIDDRTRGVIAYGDGIITSRNTFQKYFEQEELKAYIDQVLGVDAIPVALGIYFVFRDEAQAETFRASRFRSRATAPRIRLKVNKFEEYRELLQPLMDFYTDRGRLPAAEELGTAALGSLQSEFGSIKRAFNVILKATDAGEWDAIADKRRNDLTGLPGPQPLRQTPQISGFIPLRSGGCQSPLWQLPASLYCRRSDADEPGANIADRRTLPPEPHRPAATQLPLGACVCPGSA
jgi:DNA phosphorothioation-associated putative methyltransferase